MVDINTEFFFLKCNFNKHKSPIIEHARAFREDANNKIIIDITQNSRNIYFFDDVSFIKRYAEEIKLIIAIAPNMLPWSATPQKPTFPAQYPNPDI